MKQLLPLLLVSLLLASSCTRKCCDWEEPENGTCIEYRSMYYGDYSGVNVEESDSIAVTVGQLGDTLSRFQIDIPNIGMLSCEFEFDESINTPSNDFQISEQQLTLSSDTVWGVGLGSFISDNRLGVFIYSNDSASIPLFEFQGKR